MPARCRRPPGAKRGRDPADREPIAAHWLTLDAVNFGSGWFPTLRKRAGRSGYRTIAAGITEHGPWTAQQLTKIGPPELARVLGQDAGHELMALFARSLRDLGTHVEQRVRRELCGRRRRGRRRRGRGIGGGNGGAASAAGTRSPTAQPTRASRSRSSSARRSRQPTCTAAGVAHFGDLRPADDVRGQPRPARAAPRRRAASSIRRSSTGSRPRN